MLLLDFRLPPAIFRLNRITVPIRKSDVTSSDTPVRIRFNLFVILGFRRDARLFHPFADDADVLLVKWDVQDLQIVGLDSVTTLGRPGNIFEQINSIDGAVVSDGTHDSVLFERKIEIFELTKINRRTIELD